MAGYAELGLCFGFWLGFIVLFFAFLSDRRKHPGNRRQQGIAGAICVLVFFVLHGAILLLAADVVPAQAWKAHQFLAGFLLTFSALQIFLAAAMGCWVSEQTRRRSFFFPLRSLRPTRDQSVGFGPLSLFPSSASRRLSRKRFSIILACSSTSNRGGFPIDAPGSRSSWSPSAGRCFTWGWKGLAGSKSRKSSPWGSCSAFSRGGTMWKSASLSMPCLMSSC